MWKTFSLRTRISLLLCTMFLCVAVLGLVLLRGFAGQQLRDENEAAAGAVAAMTEALNAVLQASPDPQRVLDTFVAALPSKDVGAIEFKRASDDIDPPRDASYPAVRMSVPGWFVRFLDLPNMNLRHPVTIAGKRVGDLTFEPSMEADIYEKWVGFVVILTTAIGLALMTIAITYLTVGKALRPLRELDRGLGRLREGDYSGRVTSDGPAELLGSLTATNALAETLGAYDAENRSLLRKMVSIQDEERRDIARELHDELGPLLFSIRANATALADGAPGSDAADQPAQRLLTSVEELQLTNRRILERLRPNYIDTIGFSDSIEMLVAHARRQSDLKIELSIDQAAEELEPVVLQTIYRVVQEGLTNILRHAEATHASVKIEFADGHAMVDVSDDGRGLSPELKMGRGLSGMRERTRALSGSFELDGTSGGTQIRCMLPVESRAFPDQPAAATIASA